MDSLEQVVFESIARAYPHEIYALNPEEFWQFHQREFPSITREEMEMLLNRSPDYASEAA